MQYAKRCMLVILIIASLQLAACSKKADTSSKSAPAKVEKIEGSPLKRVTLTTKAAERLGIQTAPVRETVVRQPQVVEILPIRVGAEPSQRQVVPYAAVLYDAKGDTWVYTNPNPLTFVRHRIHIDYIQGDLAVLSDGPATGTAVVVVGAAELFGAETGIK